MRSEVEKFLMQIIAFKHRPELAGSIAKKLKTKIAWAEFDYYPSGELKVTGPSRVASRVTIVADVEEEPASLMSLVFLAAALRSSGAEYVTLLAPWIAYGRQDRAVKAGDSPAGLVVARILSQAFDRIITLDAHSPAFIKAFKGRLTNLVPTPKLGGGRLVTEVNLIVAPDRGASVRAQHWSHILDVPYAVLEKRRQGKEVATRIARQDSTKVKGSRILMVDDMADTGETLLSAARLLRRSGALSIHVYVTHVLDSRKLGRHLGHEIDGLDMAYEHVCHRLMADVQEGMIEQIG